MADVTATQPIDTNTNTTAIISAEAGNPTDPQDPQQQPMFVARGVTHCSRSSPSVIEKASAKISYRLEEEIDLMVKKSLALYKCPFCSSEGPFHKRAERDKHVAESHGAALQSFSSSVQVRFANVSSIWFSSGIGTVLLSRFQKCS